MNLRGREKTAEVIAYHYIVATKSILDGTNILKAAQQ